MSEGFGPIGGFIFALFLILIIICALVCYAKCDRCGVGLLFWSLGAGTVVAALAIIGTVIFVGIFVLSLGGVGIVNWFCWSALFFAFLLVLVLVCLMDLTCTPTTVCESTSSAESSGDAAC